jgi:hypothetical protein
MFSYIADSCSLEKNISTAAVDYRRASPSAMVHIREPNFSLLNSQPPRKLTSFVFVKKARLYHSVTTPIENMQTLIFDNFTFLLNLKNK